MPSKRRPASMWVIRKPGGHCHRSWVAIGIPFRPGSLARRVLTTMPTLWRLWGPRCDHPVTTSWNSYSISQLQTYLSQGYKVDRRPRLAYISEFGTIRRSRRGSPWLYRVDGVQYAEITNGWNIQTNTTQTAGINPTTAYPITLIPYSEFYNTYTNFGSWATIVHSP